MWVTTQKLSQFLLRSLLLPPYNEGYVPDLVKMLTLSPRRTWKPHTGPLLGSLSCSCAFHASTCCCTASWNFHSLRTPSTCRSHHTSGREIRAQGRRYMVSDRHSSGCSSVGRG